MLRPDEAGTGVFTVTADDAELWNKHETGGFPEPGEIVALMFPASTQ